MVRMDEMSDETAGAAVHRSRGRHVWLLGPTATSARTARHVLGRTLRAHRHDDWAEVAELAVTELVTNAVLHAHTDIILTATISPAELRVEVADSSPELPRPRAENTESTTGRGLALVSLLASSTGVDSNPAGGKTVWFTIRSDRPSPTEEDLLDAWDIDSSPLDDAQAPPRPTGHTGQTSPVAHLTNGTDPRPSEPRSVDAHASTRWVQSVRLPLAGVPLQLWLAAETHHDALLRELTLYTADHDLPGVDVTTANHARARITAAVTAAVQALSDTSTTGAATPEGHLLEPLQAVDLVIDITTLTQTKDAFLTLQHTLDVAERLAASGRLLARPGLPEVIAVRNWVCQQVTAQVEATPTIPWTIETAPSRGEPEETPTTRTLRPHHDPDLAAVRTSSRAVIAADESNRIVAVSSAMTKIIGGHAHDLVGQRITTVIPPRLREAHIAGFTRFLATGHARVLGTWLELPVLRADGTEVDCHVRITAIAGSDRNLYLAVFRAPQTRDQNQGAD